MGPAGPEPGSSGALDLPEPELSNLKDIAKVGCEAAGSTGLLEGRIVTGPAVAPER